MKEAEQHPQQQELSNPGLHKVPQLATKQNPVESLGPIAPWGGSTKVQKFWGFSGNAMFDRISHDRFALACGLSESSDIW